jgi:diguanylate cyclase (GGDEF)-like protein
MQSWRADTTELLSRDSSRARPLVTVLVGGILFSTAALYALPLDQNVDNLISDTTYTVLSLTVIAAALTTARRSQGAQRLAMSLLAGSFLVTTGLYALDPRPPEEGLSIALDAAFLPALGFWAAVVVMSLPALPGLASLRTAADAVWVTTALVIAVWPWTIGPLLAVDGASPTRTLLHVAFAISAITLSTTVLVIIPYTAGRGRVALWMLGIGGAVTSAAGVFHIRFFYEGTLRFGSWWDYLWTVGLGLLAISVLVTVEGELQPRTRGVGWHAAITVLPLVLAGSAMLVSDSGAGHLSGAIILLAVLAFRVVALLAENDRLNRSLTDEARNDPLTGLGNRRALTSGVSLIGDEARAAGRLRAVVVIDLDHFKEVNDTHGHLVGDEVLRIVARRLREAVRDRDLLVRHGGDEFVAVMIVRTEREAARAAERLGRAVRGDYALPVGSVTIDATMGVAIDPGTGDLGEIMAVADRALYEAKATGRGSFHIELCSSI